MKTATKLSEGHHFRLPFRRHSTICDFVDSRVLEPELRVLQKGSEVIRYLKCIPPGILFLLLFLSAAVNGFGQSNNGYFYYYAGEKVFLQVDTTTIALSMEGERSPAMLASLLKNGKSSLSFINEDLTRGPLVKTNRQAPERNRVRTFYAEIVNSSPGNQGAYRQQLQAFKNMPDIVMASPCFLMQNGKKMGLSNNFYVQLKDNQGMDFLYEFAKKNSVEVVGEVDFLPLWYVLSCGKNSKLNALEAANLFFETGLFVSSEPAFMPHDLLSSPNDPLYVYQWGLRDTGQYSNNAYSGMDIKAEQAWTITRGDSNIKIAVIDEGFEMTHPDLQANTFGTGYDAASGTTPSQVRGNHGTACAGIIAAIQNNNSGITGVAPNCKLISVSSNQLLSDPPIIQSRAITWAWTHGADVLSNSWAGVANSTIIDTAISGALNKGRGGKGCVVVFSTGNKNTLVEYPANSNPLILAVGAMSPCGERKDPNTCDNENWPPFGLGGSNYGTALDVMAPGTIIATTDVTGTGGYDPSDDYYLDFYGTSAACPHVAGVAALMLSVNPNLTVRQVNNIIEYTAQKKRSDLYSYSISTGRPNGTWNDKTGYGLVDAYRAVDSARNLKTVSFCGRQILLGGLWARVSPYDEPCVRNNVVDSAARYLRVDTLPVNTFVDACVDVFSPTIPKSQIPTGWVVTDFTKGTCGMYPKFGPFNTIIGYDTVTGVKIRRIDTLPPNTLVNTFQEFFPTGWIVDTFTNKTYTIPFRAPFIERTLRRISGLPSGSTVRIWSDTLPPTGWITTSLWNYLPLPTGRPVISGRITRIDGLPSGTTLNVYDPPPTGWVTIAVHGTFFGATYRTIKRIDSLPPCSIVNTCGDILLPPPSGWITLSTGVCTTLNNMPVIGRTIKRMPGNPQLVISGCPYNITVFTGPGRDSCNQIATWTAPVARSGCDSNIIGLASHQPGSVFPVGTTTVKYIFTDGTNTDTCRFTVTVIDNTPPVISGCPSDIVEYTGFAANPTPVPVCWKAILWTPPTATDNCGPVTRIYTAAPGPGGSETVWANAPSTVIYIFTDSHNNSDSCTFTITVIDSTKPVISGCPENITVEATHDCSAIVSWTPPTATDNCTFTVSSTRQPGDTFLLGTTTVTYTFTDASNNVSICSFDVTVTDFTLPIVSGCPDDITIEATYDCSAVVNWTAPTATDNCTYTVSSTHQPGDIFLVGTTTVTYTFTDANDNVSICSFDVTVTDYTAPLITYCPDDITVEATNDCSAVVDWIVPTATDNCTYMVSSTHEPGDIFPIGTTTVTYTFIDAYHNISTCIFDVTVTDYTAPVVHNCPDDIVDFAGPNCDQEVYWIEPFATDNCHYTGFASHLPGDNFPLGETVVTYTFTDESNNTSICSFTITIIDVTPPVPFNCPQVILVNAEPDDEDCAAKAFWNVPFALDNCDGLIAGIAPFKPGDVFPLGPTAFNYRFTDASNNSSFCAVRVIVTDNTPPVITGCPRDTIVGTDIVRGTCDRIVDWNPPTAVDNCGPVVVTFNHLPNDTFAIDTTIVTYTFTDISSNTSTCSFRVIVRDSLPPVISGCPANITLTNCNQIATWIPPTATDNCPGTVAVTSSHQPGATFPTGTTTVSYTFTDENQNSSSCYFNVTVTGVNNSPPVISGCPSNIRLRSDSTTCSRRVFWIPPSATSPCGDAVIVSSNHQPGDTFQVGISTVTYTFTNGSGSSICSFTVHVVDSTKPVITGCPSTVIVYTTNSACSTIVVWPPASATDNCGPVTRRSRSGQTFQLGDTYVTDSFFDAQGNWSICTFLVSVRDTIKPLITGCPADIVVSTNAADTSCSANVSWSPPTATDACYVNRTSSHNPGDAFPVGSTNVTYSFSDASNNFSICNFSVTVRDGTGPVISGCPADITVYTGVERRQCTQKATWTPPVGTDKCGSTVTRTSTHSPGATFPVGSTLVTYTFRDSFNNISTCSFKVIVIDNTPPEVKCKPFTLDLAGGFGRVTPNNIDRGSDDNCGIASMKVTPDSFTCDHAGASYPVTLTVTDIHGNVSTCTTSVLVRYKPVCTIDVTPANNTYTGGVPTNLYLGYGPQTARVTATVSGGTGFSYFWSPTNNLSCSNCSSPVFTPPSIGYYTYTVTVVNSNGCYTTCNVTFCVKDVRVPNSTNVYVCHAGSPDTTMSVTSGQAKNHLTHHNGDILGKCDDICPAANARMISGNGHHSNGADEQTADMVKVYPNPNNGSFTVELPAKDGNAFITISDVQGRRVAEKAVTDLESRKVLFALDNAASGLYFVDVILGDQRYRLKVIVK